MFLSSPVCSCVALYFLFFFELAVSVWFFPARIFLLFVLCHVLYQTRLAFVNYLMFNFMVHVVSSCVFVLTVWLTLNMLGRISAALV